MRIGKRRLLFECRALGLQLLQFFFGRAELMREKKNLRRGIRLPQMRSLMTQARFLQFGRRGTHGSAKLLEALLENRERRLLIRQLLRRLIDLRFAAEQRFALRVAAAAEDHAGGGDEFARERGELQDWLLLFEMNRRVEIRDQNDSAKQSPNEWRERFRRRDFVDCP